MKNYLKNTDNGFFYRDNLWLVLPGKKVEMSSNDIENISKIKFDIIKINKKYEFHFNEREKLLGVGWSHNFGKPGVWSEGNVSFLLFSLQEVNSATLSLNFLPYKSNKNSNFKTKIYFNNILKKTINLNDFDNNQDVVFDLKKNEINNENILMFKFEDLISPFDIFESPDARKLGILLKSVAIKAN